MRPFRFFILWFLLFLQYLPVTGQVAGIVSGSADIGNPSLKGTALYDNHRQEYILSGSGTNMWGTSDQFHFLQRELSGDFILTTSCRFEGKGVNAHRKMGLMIRADLSAGSPYADAAVHGDGLTSLQYRSAPGQVTGEIKAAVKAPDFLQLERKGDTIIMRCAPKGGPLTETGRILRKFDGKVFAGLFVCSHDSTVIEKAVFSNYRIDQPAPDNTDGYRQPSASRLELLDVENGHREVIYTTKEHIEAPNWSPDGQYLLYNSGGLLYKFPLATGIPEKINSGEVTKINNDHGISFDGKMLAISASAKMADGKTGSAIFTLPVGGGIPTPVTREVPSYWHGWSPDGKTLVYCAERKGDYDVWGIPSGGGEEFQLTNSKGLDDGPEYSPDGQYIYFNSVRTGQMKIWRMKPDGSQPEQVSFGPFHDWFAHLSPDGCKMIYVSFPAEVPAGSHPMNKRVTLQVQEVNSKESRIMAYLYGGQGTMNVPSWSPDSKRVAFVSYTYGNPEY